MSNPESPAAGNACGRAVDTTGGQKKARRLPTTPGGMRSTPSGSRLRSDTEPPPTPSRPTTMTPISDAMVFEDAPSPSGTSSGASDAQNVIVAVRVRPFNERQCFYFLSKTSEKSGSMQRSWWTCRAKRHSYTMKKGANRTTSITTSRSGRLMQVIPALQPKNTSTPRLAARWWTAPWRATTAACLHMARCDMRRCLMCADGLWEIVQHDGVHK